jgi:hypothetical protein
MGTKITGLQLAELDSAGLDQLALLVAQRGFVVFANSPECKQSYVDIGIERQLEIGRYCYRRHSKEHSLKTTPRLQAFWSSAQARTVAPTAFDDGNDGRIPGSEKHVSCKWDRRSPATCRNLTPVATNRNCSIPTGTVLSSGIMTRARSARFVSSTCYMHSPR